MILKGQLYNVTGQNTVDDKTTVSIRLNPECFIYKAHFPGNPITPGVCIVQTARELLEDLTSLKLEISEVKDVKFLNILSPVNTTDVDFVFSDIQQNDGNVKAKVSAQTGGEVFTTISFTCSTK